MNTLYLGILSVGGLLAGLPVSVAIFLDTGRRGLSSGPRLVLATGFGVGCFGGFLVPYAVQDRLAYVYFQLVKPRPIVVSPLEWVTVSVVVGLLISAILCGLYYVGMRHATSHAA